MNDLSDENKAKRRKARKGTLSCWECRRRKVKCRFASPEDAVCITCRRRGTICASQTDLSGYYATESRTRYDERAAASDDCSDDVQDAAVARTPSTGLQESPTTPVATMHGSVVEPVSDRTNGKPTAQLSKPVVAHESTPTSVHGVDSSTQPTAPANITQKLLCALPCHEDIKILLEHVNKLSLLCYQSNYKPQDEKIYEMLHESVSMTTLLDPEVHPVLLARQMLLFAIALQYLYSDNVFTGLTKHHHTIMEELAESAIKMVNMSDELLGTLEGIENFILEGLYHIDGGNIRQAWITMRRAIMAAQLLGLHRPGHYRFKLISIHSKLDPEVMWPCIVSIERSLSLLLGLPSSTIAPNSAAQDVRSASGQGSSLSQVLKYLTAKVLERNQIQGSPQAFDLTREIDQQLITMTGNLPSTFWRPSSFASLGVDSVEAFFEIRRTLNYMCYYTVVNQLHLPYILCPHHSSQSIYSRIACANASREILTREIAIRTFNPVATCSRIGGFMALVAGMTIMLIHIVSHCQETTGNLLAHHRSSDRVSVERALECMKSTSELRNDALTAKCAVLLRNLLAVEADAAQGHTYHAHALERINDYDKDSPNTLIITVPYIGIVRIAREGMIYMNPFNKMQDRGVVEDVTIGGIGSVHVNSPRLLDYTDVTAAPEETTLQEGNAPSTLHHATHISQLTSSDVFPQQNQEFPNASTSVSDWGLPDFDIAYFDVLMQGVGDLQGNGPSGERWGY